VLAARTGFNRGFDVYDDELPDAEPNRGNVFERRAPQTVARVRAWLAAPHRKPFFLWVHFQDPHGPYTPPDEFAGRFHVPAADGEVDLPVLDDNGGQGGIPPYQLVDGSRRISDYRSRYAGEIAFMDHYVGELLAAVDQHGPAIVALTSDHGESFGENGFYFAHGHSAAPDLSHVPLIIHAPGWHAARRADPVSHVDIMPTLLGLLGSPMPKGMDGVALGAIIHGDAPVPQRAVFCDVGYEVGAYWADEFLLAAIPERKTWALELFYQSGRADRERAVADAETLTVSKTFRWEGGPTWSACDSDPQLAAELAAYVGEENVVGEPIEMDPAVRERLRALGYAP
jgi:arylsulfatase A-like enzyme